MTNDEIKRLERGFQLCLRLRVGADFEASEGLSLGGLHLYNYRHGLHEDIDCRRHGARSQIQVAYTPAPLESSSGEELSWGWLEEGRIFYLNE